jgi:hypothetical protein
VAEPLAPDLDPTLALAERQLALLGQLAEMTMAVAQAFTDSAIASAKAENMILGEEWFTPEVGRAKACGARDAAESFQKATRAVRLTFMLQMNMAEIVRDIRAGHVTYLGGIAVRKDAGAPAQAPRALSDDRDRDRDHRRRDADAEHLIDIERPDTLPRAPFRDTVEHICNDVGVTVDWTAWRLKPAELTSEPLSSTPVDLGVQRPRRGPAVSARPPSPLQKRESG